MAGSKQDAFWEGSVEVCSNSRWRRQVLQVNVTHLHYQSSSPDTESTSTTILYNEITGYTVLGNDLELAFYVDQCSSKHSCFHRDAPMLVVVTSSTLSRIRFTNASDLIRCLQTFQFAVKRISVRAAQWVNTAGKVNWNKRYVLLLSSGLLLFFKDPSLQDLHRKIPLGDDCTAEPVTEEDGSISGICLTSPVIPEKKGYTMCVEGHDKLLYKSWMRKLTLQTQLSSYAQKSTTSVTGSRDGRIKQLQSMRVSQESRLSILKVVAADQFLPTPSMRELAKAGIPKDLRKDVWSGFAKCSNTTVPKEDKAPSEIVDQAISCMPASKGATDMVSALSRIESALGISQELMSIAEVVSSVFTPSADPESSSTTSLRTLRFIVTQVCNGYHSYSATSKSLCLTNDYNEEDYSVQLEMDVCVLYGILQQVFPNSSVHHIYEPDLIKVLRGWLLGAFSLNVPFGADVTARLWDVLLVDKDNSSGPNGLLISLGIAVVLTLEPQLKAMHEKGYGSDEMRDALTGNPCGKESSIVADIVVDTVYNDKRVLQFASTAAVNERRMVFWTQVSTECGNNLKLASQWQDTIDFFKGLCSETIAHLNSEDVKVATSKGSKENVKDLNDTVRTITEDLHLSVVSLRKAVSKLEENVLLASRSLTILKNHGLISSSSTPLRPLSISPNDYTMSRLNGEAQGIYNVKIIRGPQVVINFGIVELLAQRISQFTWTLNSALWQYFHLNDRIAFRNLHHNARCVTKESASVAIGSEVGYVPLSSLATFLAPPNETGVISKVQATSIALEEQTLKLIQHTRTGLSQTIQSLTKIGKDCSEAGSPRSPKRRAALLKSGSLIKPMFDNNEVELVDLTGYLQRLSDEVSGDPKRRIGSR